MTEDRARISDAQDVAALANQNRILSRRIDRERQIRHKAEEIAEQGLRDLYNHQRELEFLSQISIMANQAGSAGELLRAALDYICGFTGWPAAHAYIVSGQGAARRMWPSNIWYCDPGLDISAFRAATAGDVVEHGMGLPGQVWQSGEPVWLDDLAICSNFVRRDAALQSGLRAAFSTPLMVGSEVGGSLEFFGPNPAPPDAALLGLLARAGSQLGRVIERDDARARLRDAMLDSLTGLPSRPQFVREVEQSLREYALDPTAGFCVLYVDLDRFKMVNDSLGHAAGDTLITQVGSRLKDAISQGAIAGRETDGVPPALLARVGGDEFTLLVPGISCPEGALAIADRIQHVLREPFRVEGHDVVTGASIGIALCSPEDGSADEVVRHADMAMYHAKARGKARSEIYDSDMQARATSRMALHNQLRAAVEDNAFTLHYQPVVSLADDEIVGVEALLRWKSSPTTLRNPDEFIPTAEETGLIVPLGSWALREACHAAGRWNATRAGRRPLSVSVNLSPRQLVQPDLVEDVRGIIAETGIRPELLVLEVTESTAMEDPDFAAEVLNRLGALGVRISIDDFGTGYSSLSYLHRLPLHELKIDRVFIEQMGTNHESRQIVNTIVVLARSIGLAVIAEGAETAEDVERLRAMGCNFYQGFFASPPVPEDRFLALLDSWP